MSLSISKLKGSKKKEMLNRLLKPALEMKERQEKYEFFFLLLFLHALSDLDLCDLTVLLSCFSPYIGSLIGSVMKNSSKWHMKRAR